jgi:hypothetical protein
MTRLSAPLAAIAAAMLATSAVGCQAVDSGSSAELTDVQRPISGLAIDALAAELGIPKDRIVVVSVTAIDWPDSSLGCPKPCMAYLQVVTPGHKVMLRVDDALYAVHEAKNKAFVCRQAPPERGTSGGGQIAYGHQMLMAQKDLAERLGVPVREIRPAGAEKKTWSDASLGCPEAGVQYAQVETHGWVLKLRHGTRDYTYHADAQRAIPCPAIETR